MNQDNDLMLAPGTPPLHGRLQRWAKRWAFNILAAVSLASCLATAALYIRGYWVVDSWYPGLCSTVFYSHRGEICAQWTHPDWGWDRMIRSTSVPLAKHEFLIGQFSEERLTRASRPRLARGAAQFPAGTIIHWHLAVRDWFLILLFALPPTMWLIRVRRRPAQLQEGLCLGCGYDLRAHTPGERCPECGILVEMGKARER